MKSFFKDKLSVWAGCILGLATALGAFPSTAHAQVDLVEVTPLYFGQIAIPDYNLVGRVTINSSGTYSYNNVYLHTPPTRGEYLLQSPGNINTMYTVTFPPSVNLTGPGGNFILDQFTTAPAVLITNGIGEDTLFISGRLQTQGGGISYSDGTYQDTFTVTINF
jgi:Domain of unknown function (DUF4402)